MHKTTLLTLIALAIALTSFGQAPEAFKYQAVVRDAGGVILTNQAVGYQLTILQGSPSGTAVYTETFSPTTNGYGLVNLEIGTGTTTDDFTLIDWANGPFYMETAADVTGGTSYVIMGTSQLISVPYALYAKTSGSSTPGPQGPAGNDGVDGTDGNDGLSAYEVWIGLGNTGTETDFINSLTGPQGPAGNDGIDGATGPQGIQGPQGLPGNDGIDGVDGLDGATGPMGPQGPQGLPGADGIDGVDGLDGAPGPAGTNGTNGVSVNWLGSFATAPVSPSINDGYYNSTVGISYIWNGAWNIIAQDGTAPSSGSNANTLLYTVDGF